MFECVSHVSDLMFLSVFQVCVCVSYVFGLV